MFLYFSFFSFYYCLYGPNVGRKDLESLIKKNTKKGKSSKEKRANFKAETNLN